MKQVILQTLIIALAIITLNAQSPEAFKYQAVARGTNGQPLTNQSISLQISILQTSASGTVVYSETHSATTNDFGLFVLNIGEGTVGTGNFTTIDWGADNYFIQIKMDETGGTSYNLMGTSQLLSVPYALYAEKANNVANDQVDDADADPANEIQNLSLSGNDLTISSGNTVTLTDNVDDADADPSNELQVLSISNDTVYLSDGGYAKLPAGFDGDYNSLTNTPDFTNWDTDVTDDFDGQYSSLAGVPTNVSDFTNDAGYITSPDDADADPANEIQIISISNDTIYLSNGGFVELPAGFDGDYNNLTNAPTNVSTFTNDAGYLTSITETDPSVPNGTQNGDMQYWDGSAWVLITNTGYEGATLTLVGGVPTWVGGTPPTVTNPTTGKTWMDRNLGASQVATSSTNSSSYGHLFQWGREADGHESRSSGTTTTQSTGDSPGHGNFIRRTSAPYDWRNPSNDNLWQGSGGTNNPCPSGFRIPTQSEWTAERSSWSSQDAAGAFASPLKLPLAGRRYYSGSLNSVGSTGYYWSSGLSGSTGAQGLTFDNSTASTGYGAARAYGFSVRCIQ